MMGASYVSGVEVLITLERRDGISRLPTARVARTGRQFQRQRAATGNYA